jgi:pyruvate dehydrogenase E1 component
VSDAEKPSENKNPAIVSVIHEGMPTQLPDIDPEETR